jgi:hypothetical protein
MSISRDGNYLLHRAGTDSKIVGTLIGPHNSLTFKPAPDLHYAQERLLEISKLMESMAEPRIQPDQPDAPTTGTEEADRPRVVSGTVGGNNLFRGTVGPDSKPIGSIEDGPVFAPAPGVTFSRHELSEVAERLRQKEEALAGDVTEYP